MIKLEISYEQGLRQIGLDENMIKEINTKKIAELTDFQRLEKIRIRKLNHQWNRLHW